MTITLNKNWIFSGLLLVIALLIIVRIIPERVDQVVKVTISKNRTNIKNIHQERDITATRVVTLDRLELLHKGRFGHPKLGNIAQNSDDFFVDVSHRIQVNTSGQYRFLIGSDDGFSLSVDGKKICEHVSDRPYSVQTCNLHLTSGSHEVNISYFQGFGNSGFTVQYAFGNDKPRWFGDNSKHVRF